MINLDTFIGNTEMIQLLKIECLAAKARNKELPHILLKGPAGCGKTTLGEALAREFGNKPLTLTPNTAKNSDLLRKFFLNMPDEGYDEEGNIVDKINPQIVFIDEVHQLSLLAQELLGIAMHDWRLPVTVDGRDEFEWVPRFTLIGATTLPGKLSKPFRDRFKVQALFETYDQDESLKIVGLHAQSEELQLGEGVAEAIATRSRGVGRLVVNLLGRLASAAAAAAAANPEMGKIITLPLANKMFTDLLHIDDRGLSKTDIKILRQLHKIQDPVGVDTLAAITNEDKSTLENEVEPYLVQEGLMARTKRGRVLTDEGRRYLHTSGYIKEAPSMGRMGRVIGAPER
jgi:Holliday junction DNA helicase RuvB